MKNSIFSNPLISLMALVIGILIGVLLYPQINTNSKAGSQEIVTKINQTPINNDINQEGGFLGCQLKALKEAEIKIKDFCDEPNCKFADPLLKTIQNALIRDQNYCYKIY